MGSRKKDVQFVDRKDSSGEYPIDVTVHLGPEAFTAVLYLHSIDGRRLEYSRDILSLIYTTAEERQDEKYLEHVAHALQKLSCHNNLTMGEFLIIIGNCKCDSPENYFNYQPYLYKNGQFVLQQAWLPQ